ncbi:MAG TPA: hypothetical protein PL070_13325 [Flavobacteriales bacterium]|nr:hypothetical protein [Flavobacteriales bacterium]
MRIKQSQLNEFLHLIADADYVLDSFEVPNLDKMKYNTLKFEDGWLGSKYRFSYKENQIYYFLFETHGAGKFCNPEFCPGVNYANEIINDWVSWKRLKETFELWLNELSKELTAEIAYKSFFNKGASPFLKFKESADDYFTEAEVREIKVHLLKIKSKLPELELTEFQIHSIEKKLDDFIESCKIDKKNKWLDYVIGGIFSATIGLAINTDTANKLFYLIKSGIESLIFVNVKLIE